MKCLLAATAALMLCGCTSTYWRNRADDLTDAAYLGYDGISLGASANVSSASAGAYIMAGPDGYGLRSKYGLGGVQEDRRYGGWMLVAGPAVRDLRPRSRIDYGGSVPPFGAVGVNLGLGLGLSVQVDIVEFFDFLLGFCSFDIVQDDFQDQKVEDVSGEDI